MCTEWGRNAAITTCEFTCNLQIILLAAFRWAELSSETEGFYVSQPARNAKQNIVLASIVDDAGAASKRKQPGHKQKDIMLQIYRPNTGLQVRHESLADIQKKYKKVTSDDAMGHWIEQYDASVNTCSHAYWRGSCRNLMTGNECEVNIEWAVSNLAPPPHPRCHFGSINCLCPFTKQNLPRSDCDDEATQFYRARFWACGSASSISSALGAYQTATKCK